MREVQFVRQPGRKVRLLHVHAHGLTPTQPGIEEYRHVKTHRLVNFGGQLALA
jgi:hypothetical protein